MQKLIIKSTDSDKIQLIINLASELNIEIQADQSTIANKQVEAEEPTEPYKKNFSNMKNAFFVQASSTQKMDLFFKMASALGIHLFPINNNQLEDTLLAQRSLSAEWNAPENEHWDEFLRTHKIQ